MWSAWRGQVCILSSCLFINWHKYTDRTFDVWLNAAGALISNQLWNLTLSKVPCPLCLLNTVCESLISFSCCEQMWKTKQTSTRASRLTIFWPVKLKMYFYMQGERKEPTLKPFIFCVSSQKHWSNHQNVLWCNSIMCVFYSQAIPAWRFRKEDYLSSCTSKMADC